MATDRQHRKRNRPSKSTLKTLNKNWLRYRGRVSDSKEDPTKFLQVFFDRPGYVSDFIDKKTGQHSVEKDRLRGVRDALRRIGRFVDPGYYQLLERERIESNAGTGDPRLELQKHIDAKPRRRKELVEKLSKALNVKTATTKLTGLHLDTPPVLDRSRNSDLDLPPARIYKSLKDVEGYADAREDAIAKLASLGRIKSTLVIGEISLAGAQIGGSVSLLGMIANVFGNKRGVRDTIILDNAVIRDDLDLRDTVGLCRISAEQTSIGGSLRMADRPKFDLKTDRHGPARRRALLVGEPFFRNGTDHPFGRYNFVRSTIGGDATFVFDQETGPSIKLAFSNVTGQINFLPARGGVELSRDEYESEAFRAAQTSQAGTISFERIVLRIRLKLARIASRALKLKKCEDYFSARHKMAFPDEDPKTTILAPKPTIDLRSVNTTVLGHPPSAWPKFDGLRVEGLNYEMTKEIGPLLSARRTWKQVNRQALQNVLKVGITCFAAFLASFIVPFVGDIAATVLIDEPLHWYLTGEVFDPKHALFGPRNILFCQFIVGGSIWIILMRLFTHPKGKDARPMAMDYLRLQRRKFNVRRVSGAVHPYQPYIHAAKVLRNGGYTLSADKLELERLRLRRKALSWRTSAPLRIILKLTDLTMNYGFAPIRLIGIALVLLAAGSLLTSAGKQTRIIEEVPIESVPIKDSAASQRRNTLSRATDTRRGGAETTPETQSQSTGGGDALETEANRLANIKNPFDEDQGQGGSGTGNSVNSANFQDLPQLVPFIYALDVTVPFLDLDQEDRFIFIVSECDETSMKPKFVKVFWMIPILLKLLGWVVTSLIAISVASRLETILARNEET